MKTIASLFAILILTPLLANIPADSKTRHVEAAQEPEKTQVTVDTKDEEKPETPSEVKAPKEPEPPKRTRPSGLNERERIAWDFYIDRGFTETATAYLLGTMKQESSVTHNGRCGDGGIACGLFQWHPGRRADMPNTFIGQLEFSVMEMDRDAQGMGRAATSGVLKESDDPGEVAHAIKRWIRYGEAGRRYIFAQDYLARL